VLVKTGATLLVKEGLKACAKAAAKELAQNVASGLAAELANYAGTLAGLSEEQKQWLKIGVDGYQAFALFRAARVKLNPNGNCFVAGTQVLVGYGPDGSPVTRDIEDVRVGDHVLSRDQRSAGDDVSAHRVARTFVRTSDHIRTLAIRDASGNVETIQTTDEHPLWVVGKGWTKAGDLQLGDWIGEADGSNDAVVVATSREEHPDGVTVYNFEVEGDHTYFVEDGAGDATTLWVHNQCVGDKFIARLKGRGIDLDFGPNARAQSQTFKLRSQTETSALDAISATPKRQFSQSIASDPQVVSTLRANHVPESEITRMLETGQVPTGWQVHHKRPLKWGGDNSQANFILMKDQPFHRAITSEQGSMQAQMSALGLEVDGEFEISWPVFSDRIFPL
jgi:hypothetical protein